MIIEATDQDGNVPSRASAGNVGFKGSRKSTPYAVQTAAEAAARRAMEHGVRKVDVQVKGPGSGREDRHPLDPERRHRGDRHQGRHPRPPQRLPPAQAAGGLRLVAACRFATGPKAESFRRLGVNIWGTSGENRAFERRPYLPGEHGQPAAATPAGLALAQEKQKARFTYGLNERQFRNLYEEASSGTPATASCSSSSSAVSTTSSTGRAGIDPPPGAAVRQPWPRRGQRSARRHPQLPRKARATWSACGARPAR